PPPPAAVSVLGVGWTRTYLGVHWPSDVVGGWLLGWFCVSVAILAYRRSGRRGVRTVPGAGEGGDEDGGSRMDGER
uniref:phosphatase PAP2 family protein n=1 Tax=Streptomyces sp. bgisy126 TaxID=3413787 RepID=UPI003EBFB927